ncbi:putative nADPH-ferredoxin reductase fpra [Mycobacteroides abscessus subsp. bolletii 1513]|uniref:Putative nADPH-ferredoxin reductase fpra n=1 Tax=Mycobacteroides abscessus subsp. bolletii 1513 TaxID=1299321 RepID=X8DC33_9MYCO|nr:putative nADPH-ferredoxin reductase fpra [Mycobacteroides abscessus subsp. bolletii 1513]
MGKDITHEELLAHHHAVIYSVGASSDRRLDIPGIELPGNATATQGRVDQRASRLRRLPRRPGPRTCGRHR